MPFWAEQAGAREFGSVEELLRARSPLRGVVLPEEARVSATLAALAEASGDFSGAEIEEAIVSALYEGFSRGEELHTDHVRRALRDTVPLARTMPEHLQRLRDWARGRARPAHPPPDVPVA